MPELEAGITFGGLLEAFNDLVGLYTECRLKQTNRNDAEGK